MNRNGFPVTECMNLIFFLANWLELVMKGTINDNNDPVIVDSALCGITI
jgi:hypothetical protein